MVIQILLTLLVLRYIIFTDVILYVSQHELKIEQYLIHLKTWGENWKMPYNVDKCFHVPAGFEAIVNHLRYSFCKTPLITVNSHFYLGIQLPYSLRCGTPT